MDAAARRRVRVGEEAQREIGPAVRLEALLGGADVRAGLLKRQLQPAVGLARPVWWTPFDDQRRPWLENGRWVEAFIERLGRGVVGSFECWGIRGERRGF